MLVVAAAGPGRAPKPDLRVPIHRRPRASSAQLNFHILQPRRPRGLTPHTIYHRGRLKQTDSRKKKRRKTQKSSTRTFHCSPSLAPANPSPRPCDLLSRYIFLLSDSDNSSPPPLPLPTPETTPLDTTGGLKNYPPLFPRSTSPAVALTRPASGIPSITCHAPLLAPSQHPLDLPRRSPNEEPTSISGGTRPRC